MPMAKPDFAQFPIANDAWTMDQHEQEERRWLDLLAQVSAEVSGPLTSSMERVNALLTTGSIDPQSVRALRSEIERARGAGMIGQQLARFASRRLKQHPERVPLTQMLRDVLLQRARETQARGVQLKQQLLQPIEVIVDPSLLFSLLNTVLDWVLDCARSHIEFRIDMKPWPAYGRLTCRFVHRPLDELDDGEGPDPSSTVHLNSLTWRLAQQTAQTMGVKIERQDELASTLLIIEFPRTVTEQTEAAGVLELEQESALCTNSKPLAGSHVLVLASRREIRVQVREALRHMGLLVDFVASVDEAIAFCGEGLPHALVFEAVLSCGRFDDLRAQILEEVPDFVFIEIAEEGNELEVSGFSSSGMARVGRDALESSLPSALLFELSRGL